MSTVKQTPAAIGAIGILGTGRMGVRLAAMFARAGRRVVLGSRDPARAARIVRELGIPNLVAGSYHDATGAPAVLPAAFIRDGLFDLLEEFRAQLDGKVLVDITNPFDATYEGFLTPWDTSAAEELQKRFPRAQVVGAFKNVWWEVFDEPEFDGAPSDVYVVSDHAAAKSRFLAFAAGTPFRYVDAGRLENARTVERMTLLAGELGQRMKFYPRMNWRLLGREWQPGSRDRVSALIQR